MRMRKKLNGKLCIFIIILFLLLNLRNVDLKFRKNIDSFMQFSVNKDVYKVVFNAVNDEFMGKDAFSYVDVIKNKSDEIVMINYKLNEVYKSLGSYIVKMYEGIDSVFVKNDYYDKDYNCFFIPVGMLSKTVLFSNFGYKVPFRAEIFKDVNIGFETKVQSYGINNVLLELHIIIKTKNMIIQPFYEEVFSKDYDVIVFSQLMVGKLPDYYGGILEKSSSIVSS